MLRIDTGDPLAQAVAERVAVDAREAGLTIKVQAPAGLAPRPDARFVRVAFEATTPDRALADAMAALAAGVERLASSDAVRRTAADAGRAGADRAAYVDEATSLAAAQGWELLDLVADEGTIVSSAQWPARFGYKHPWATAAIGERRAFLQTIELPHETALGLVAVRKVAARDGGLIVAGGRRLDSSFLQSLVLPAGMRALLYRNVEPEVSRQQLFDPSGQAAQGAQLEPLIARVRQSGREAAETIQWPDGPERVDAIPLAGRDGTTLGVLLVGSSGRELAALVSRIRWAGVAFGALGLIFGFILRYVVAARVTRPVEQLAEASRSVARGDWNVTVSDVQASGEIEELARAFDTMTKQLADQRERLIQTERVAAWRELARRLAHELKNPLFPARHPRQYAPRQSAAGRRVRRSVRGEPDNHDEWPGESQHRHRPVQRLREDAAAGSRDRRAERRRPPKRAALSRTARSTGASPDCAGGGPRRLGRDDSR
jgi:HAMP domain-containing protein